MSETLAQARIRLRQRLGAGARFDAANAPNAVLISLRLARAACLRHLHAITDDALGNGATARQAARLGCTARAIAEAFEHLCGHPGLEGDANGRAGTLDAEIASAETLPGRALRSLYLHAMQHLDVSCRDLDGALWTAMIVVPGVAAGTPTQALVVMTELLWSGAASFKQHSDAATPGLHHKISSHQEGVQP